MSINFSISLNVGVNVEYQKNYTFFWTSLLAEVVCYHKIIRIQFQNKSK